MTMGEIPFFIPFIESKDNKVCQSLYRVETLDASPEYKWYICGTTDKLLTNKIEKGLEFFSVDTSPPIQFSVKRYETDNPYFIPVRQDSKESSQNTQSMCLGIFIAAYRHLKHLSFKNNWASITISGDLVPHDNKVDLAAVCDIEGKFKAVQFYAAEHEGKHLFLYISNKTEREPGSYDNIEVIAFTDEYPIGAVIAEIFEPHFNEEQTRLFDKCEINKMRKFVTTRALKDMKKRAFSKDWKGFLIHGVGETGKSVMALELAQYLATAEKIYAPVWVKIENKKLQEYIEKPRSINYSLENQNLLDENPVAAYIAKEIIKTLNMDQSSGGDLSLPASAIDRGNAAPYLLVIDNLELDRVIEVIDAVQIIIAGVKNKPPFIITSRFDEKVAGYTQNIGLNNKSQNTPMNLMEIEALVGAISEEQEYAQKLNYGSDEYYHFIVKLHENFNLYPGIIAKVVPQLAYKKLSDLNTQLLSMKDLKLDEKINTVYRTIFSQLDDFTQIVLFAFINAILEQTFDKIIKDIRVNKREISEYIDSFGFVFQDDTPLELSEIQENVPNALIELARCHLIYQTSQNNSYDDTGYSIKTLTYLTFIFGEGFEGSFIDNKSMRDIMLTNIPDIIYEGFYTNQPINIIEKYLNKLKEYDKDFSLYAFHCIAASVSDKPEYIDLLLKLGYQLDVCWKRESYKNPIQCAASYNSNLSIIEKLVDKGADLKSCGMDGLTLLHLAAANNSNPEIIAYLIDKGLDMYAKDNSNYTPLHYAVYNTNKAIIEKFYNKGAKLDTVLSKNITLLHIAAKTNNLDIAAWLIDKGLDVYAVDNNGFTPLHSAVCIDNNTEMINLLLEHGAISDINKPAFIVQNYIFFNETTDLTPLNLAAIRNKTGDNIDLLINKGAMINFKTLNGYTPLHLAAMGNNEPEMINFLLEHNADINAKTAEGKTPVYFAAYNENPQVAIALIKAGATLDDEVQGKGLRLPFFPPKKYTALKSLKKRKDWPLIKAAIEAN